MNRYYYCKEIIILLNLLEYLWYQYYEMGREMYSR